MREFPLLQNQITDQRHSNYSIMCVARSDRRLELKLMKIRFSLDSPHRRWPNWPRKTKIPPRRATTPR